MGAGKGTDGTEGRRSANSQTTEHCLQRQGNDIPSQVLPLSECNQPPAPLPRTSQRAVQGHGRALPPRLGERQHTHGRQQGVALCCQQVVQQRQEQHELHACGVAT